ncbi:MAG: RNA polymerase sigma factor [Bacteroidetes bacterium]|nr:RNA polymerase sigma factor [Bacteroidota bacterium]
MDKNTQNNLVIKAGKGDQNAIGELFKLYWRAARAAAFGVTGNIELAEDAASEAFYTAITNIEDLLDTGKFGPWLYTIVIRSAKHIKNSKSSNNAVIQGKFFENIASGDISDLEKGEIAFLLRQAVGDLQDILREAISLYYFEGYNIEQISDFLDIPIGTVKRRLHDGRNVLRESAQKILKGKKPMNNKRQQTLILLNDFLEKGGDSDDFRKVMRQAMTLRPVPYELLRKIFSKHSPIAKKLTDPEERKKYELRAHKAMEIFSKIPQKVTDLNHPVGKAVIAIKSALPEFKERTVDTNALAENIIKLHTAGEVNSSLGLPPGFAEGIPGSFISFSRGLFLEKEDGSLCTMYELDQQNDEVSIRENGLISEALHLIWLRTETIELHSVEELLRDLCDKVVPNLKFNFSPYTEPRFCSGLRMRFDGIAVPAATGGVHFLWPGLPDGVSVASVVLYLEAWAFAQSGQHIELERLEPFLKKIRSDG